MFRIQILSGGDLFESCPWLHGKYDNSDFTKNFSAFSCIHLT